MRVPVRAALQVAHQRSTLLVLRAHAARAALVWSGPLVASIRRRAQHVTRLRLLVYRIYTCGGLCSHGTSNVPFVLHVCTSVLHVCTSVLHVCTTFKICADADVFK